MPKKNVRTVLTKGLITLNNRTEACDKAMLDLVGYLGADGVESSYQALCCAIVNARPDAASIDRIAKLSVDCDVAIDDVDAIWPPAYFELRGTISELLVVLGRPCNLPLSRKREEYAEAGRCYDAEELGECSGCVVCERKDAEDGLDRMLASATAHGEESEPDMEVGDLQALCRLLWDRLDTGERQVVEELYEKQVGLWPETE